MRKLRTRSHLIAATAVLSLALAACGGDDADNEASEPEATQAPETSETEMAAPDSTIAIAGTDSLKYDPEALETTAGLVEITLTSGAVEHNLSVTVDGTDTLVVEAGEGETVSGTIELAAGEYTFFCNVPGHREAGMEGTLTVS